MYEQIEESIQHLRDHYIDCGQKSHGYAPKLEALSVIADLLAVMRVVSQREADRLQKSIDVMNECTKTAQKSQEEYDTSGF